MKQERFLKSLRTTELITCSDSKPGTTFSVDGSEEACEGVFCGIEPLSGDADDDSPADVPVVVVASVCQGVLLKTVTPER
ncbi:hypothetical protein M9Y10_021330 [Tritrichomonas musculus]|uniref:Uncharacterized protein n=1 Tax=Tritrichomonas musculus TaxID=1915356 RepID=A0ABR2HEQ7_9EUKA